MGSTLLIDGSVAIMPDGGRARDDCCSCGGGGDCTLAEGSLNVYDGKGKNWSSSACGTCVPFTILDFSCCCDLGAHLLAGSATWSEIGWHEGWCNGFKVKRNYRYDGTAALVRKGDGTYRWQISVRLRRDAWCGEPAVDQTDTFEYGQIVDFSCFPPVESQAPTGSNLVVTGPPQGSCQECQTTSDFEKSYEIHDQIGCDLYGRQAVQKFDRGSFGSTLGHHVVFTGSVTITRTDPCPGNACKTGGKGRGGGVGGRGDGGGGGGGGGCRSCGRGPVVRWMGIKWYGRPWPRRVVDRWRFGVRMDAEPGCGCVKRLKDAWERARRWAGRKH